MTKDQGCKKKRLTIFYLIELSIEKLPPYITIIYANALIISSIFGREREKEKVILEETFNFASTPYIYFSYIKPCGVLCFAVRGHSVFVQPFVKLPRCLLSYFDISVRLVHVWIQNVESGHFMLVEQRTTPQFG